MYIYKTTNMVNNKIYVGLSKYNPEENPEYLGSGYLLKKAIKCYGVHAFTKTILEICKTKEELLLRERYWISCLNARDRNIGYNICEGGTWGDTWTYNPRKEELRQKLREMMLGAKNPNYGNKWSIHQRKIASERCKLMRTTIDKKTGLNIAKSPEVRRKLSDTKKGFNNPRAKLWKLISPTGEVFIFEGGIVPHLKTHGLTRQQFSGYNCTDSDKDVRTSKKGWKLYRLPKPIEKD